ncbi:MAG TPA: PilZ domain-containing protein [Polyangiaceae bacterium]|nr:PilZ domain-containing protein [Polyangiaceae bacterium]
MEERRSFARQLTCIPAYFESEADPQDVALIRDVSTSGARLFTRAKLDLDETLTLHLYLGAETDEPRKTSGRIVRVERRDPDLADVWPWEIGVEFDVAITPYQKEIEELCARQLAAGVLKR